MGIIMTPDAHASRFKPDTSSPRRDAEGALREAYRVEAQGFGAEVTDRTRGYFEYMSPEARRG